MKLRFNYFVYTRLLSTYVECGVSFICSHNAVNKFEIVTLCARKSGLLVAVLRCLIRSIYCGSFVCQLSSPSEIVINVPSAS